MGKCDYCGENVALPYKCSYCEGIFCSKHRLPERHNCAELKTAVPPKPYVPKKRKSSKDFVKDTETSFIKKRYVDTKKISKGSKKISKSVIFKSFFYIFVFIIISISGYNYQYLEYKDLNNFSSIEELITFLNSDDTDTLTWSESFTCADFTETLIERGKEKGYIMWKYTLEGSELIKYEESWISYAENRGYIVWWGEGDSHAVCKTYISELNEYVLIEPQNDAIFTIEEYKVLYGGGI